MVDNGEFLEVQQSYYKETQTDTVCGEDGLDCEFFCDRCSSSCVCSGVLNNKGDVEREDKGAV